MTDERTLVAERRTDRWVGLVGAVLVATALAALTRTPTLLLVAAFGTAVLAYNGVVRPPEATVAVERRVETRDPGVGQRVSVETTVRNVGDRTLADVRAADGIPPATRVVDGSARAGAVLRPGESVTLAYDLAGGPGAHRFEPATVAVRDVAGLVERRVELDPSPDRLTWTQELSAADVPVEPRTGLPGRTPADRGGAGVAFHSVREHRPGDPLGRVDWNRFARTGDLSTVEFRRREAASVVLAVDTRYEAALAPEETADTAIERSVSAAGALFEGLYAAGHRVGLAALPATACWVPPARGRAHRDRTRRRLTEDPAFAETSSGTAVRGTLGERLLAELPSGAHVVVLSPLCDDDAFRLARRIDARGNPVSVISPDPTATDTPGGRVAALERRERLARLRETGVDVYDWPADAPFERVVADDPTREVVRRE